MSLRLEMLQVARLAPRLLEGARDVVVEFLSTERGDDGGFYCRDKTTDLYYTVFGLDSLVALQADWDKSEVVSYLSRFGNGEDLDLVHLSCLARAWSAIDQKPPLNRGFIVQRLEGFRAQNGGYAGDRNGVFGTAYDAFLTYGAYQDLGMNLPNKEGLLSSLRELSTPDGGYANRPGLRVGATPATSAVLTLLRHLDETPPDLGGKWLLDQLHEQGGFMAVPGAPMPDLLSTATALHALAGMQMSFDGAREACLDYLDTLWTGRSFCGSWADDMLDSEYTFYALLALGHLSL